MALCDARTVQPEKDLEPADLVYAEYVVENRQIYQSSRHKWYYISDQQPDEAWIFMQSDTDPNGISGTKISPLGDFLLTSSGVAHSAFPNPLSSPKDPPRESVEVRALVYYADAEIVEGNHSRRS